MRTRQKCVATDTWRSLGCRTTPLEHWSRRKPTVEPSKRLYQPQQETPTAGVLVEMIFRQKSGNGPFEYIGQAYPGLKVIFSGSTRPYRNSRHRNSFTDVVSEFSKYILQTNILAPAIVSFARIPTPKLFRSSGHL